MKELRSVRKEWITRASARLKEQKKNLKAIKGHLEEGPGTVPRIAEATGISPDRVLWYIAALKKYGEISEAEKDGSYFRYILTGKRPAEGSDDFIEKASETV